MVGGSARQLAARLARSAREIGRVHGEVAAQTVVYALFVRRVDAAAPVESVLRGFEDRGAIELVESVLDGADVDAVAAEFAAQERDPAVYFYEAFTRACDAGGARRRGVHYSPPEVVSYISRGIESILLEQFGLTLSDVTILDPCCGVGTFLRHLRRSSGQLLRMIGVEVMPAACRIASVLVDGCEVREVNSLDCSPIDTHGAPLVVLGNPPYSGHSSNAGCIAELMLDYREGLVERNPKWLQDDYVKFIRMAQHQVESAGRGIVAFITNHSFTFNPTFRAMRESLMATFDQISVLDLLGNGRRADESEEQDENIFAVRAGVAVSFMVKDGGGRECETRYACLKGTRDAKLRALSEMSLESTPWTKVEARRPFLLLLPRDADLESEYAGFAPLVDLFGAGSVGFVTSRDAFAVDSDRDALLSRIAALRDDRISPQIIRRDHAVGDLDIEAARAALQADPEWQQRAIEVLYRPFDKRWAYYSPAVMERPRLPFMRNMMHENVALAVGRAGQATGSGEWDVVFCADAPADLNLFRRGGAMILPRLVYDGATARSNLTTQGFDHEALFCYIYAVLHSSEYRSRYADFLTIDFPRIPLPGSGRQLNSLARAGEELISVHLMRVYQPEPDDAISMRIGGYDLPRKYVQDRKHRDLMASEADHLARIRSALARTAELRARIDRLMAADPPWG